MFKKSLLTDRFNLYSLKDAAINLEKSDAPKYQETLDPQHLTFVDGATPSIFVSSPLSTRQRGKCIACLNSSGKYEELSEMVTLAFRYGIRDIQNFELGAAPIPLIFEETPEGKMLSLQSLDLLQDQDLVFEIGQYILSLSHLSPFLPRG